MLASLPEVPSVDPIGRAHVLDEETGLQVMKKLARTTREPGGHESAEYRADHAPGGGVAGARVVAEGSTPFEHNRFGSDTR